MGEYYDKEKFTGGRPSGGGPRNSQTPPPGGYPPPPNRGPYQTPPPRRPYQTPPPVQKKNNSGWYSWPVIIILFAVGAWPIALALLFLNIFSDGLHQYLDQAQTHLPSFDQYERRMARRAAKGGAVDG